MVPSCCENRSSFRKACRKLYCLPSSHLRHIITEVYPSGILASEVQSYPACDMKLQINTFVQRITSSLEVTLFMVIIMHDCSCFGRQWLSGGLYHSLFVPLASPDQLIHQCMAIKMHGKHQIASVSNESCKSYAFQSTLLCFRKHCAFSWIIHGSGSMGKT